jgi:ribA/ribD-fused uncharacterized protein
LNPTNREELVASIAAGNHVDYLFFYGEQKPASGVSETCLSQWYDSPFECDGIRYRTAEHYMMAMKARLFDDEEIHALILSAETPLEVKMLGRRVRNFDEALWREQRYSLVVRANLCKFSQHPELREFLLNTGEKILVEASMLDPIWGIGLSATHPSAMHPAAWRGENLLGFALMEVRSRLAG